MAGEGQEGMQAMEPGMSGEVFSKASDRLFSGQLEGAQLKNEVVKTLNAALEVARENMRAAKQKKPNIMHTDEEKRIFGFEAAVDVVRGLRSDPAVLKSAIAEIVQMRVQIATDKRDKAISRIPNRLGGFWTKDPNWVGSVVEKFEAEKTVIAGVAAKINEGADRWWPARK